MSVAPGGGQDVAVLAQQLYHTLRERWWLIALAVLACLGLAAAYIAVTPKIYRATALVEVEGSEPNVVNIQEVSRADLETVESLMTIERNFAGRELPERLIGDDALGLTPEKLGFDPGAKPTRSQMVWALRSRIDVGLVRGTRLIAINVEDRDPELAAKLANRLVEQYKEMLIEQRSGLSGEANLFLMEERDRLAKLLESSERALQGYREKTQSVSLEGTQNIVVAQLQELNARVTAAKADRLKLEAAAARIKSMGVDSPAELLSITAIAEAPEVIEQQKMLAQTQSELVQLNERYLEKHPKLIRAKKQADEVRENLYRAARSAADGIQIQYETAGETEKNYAVALEAQEQAALRLNAMAIDYKSLERDVESDRALYESVLKRMKETGVSGSVTQSIIHLSERAVPPEKPVKPRKKLVLAGGLAAGLALGVGLSLLLGFFDKTFRTADQVELALGLPILAAVPKSSSAGGVMRAASPVIGEAFRTLRTALTLRGEGRKMFLFTGAEQGDGKTFCAVNFAASLARLKLRVLLIDADLRLPTVGALFFGDEARPGLAEVLADRRSFEEVVARTEIESLSVLTAGEDLAEPAELLHGPALGMLLKKAALQFDYIVIDSPPVQAVSDSLLLARQVDSVCFVLRIGRTHRKAASKACSQLAGVGRAPVGVILNETPVDSGGYYYHQRAGAYGVYGEAKGA